MAKFLLIFSAFACALWQKSLFASDELKEEAEGCSSHKSLLLTHQDIADRLSKGLFGHKKLRMQLALAPAAPEYLTEEFIAIMQNLSQKMDVYEKCYIVRALIKVPATHLTALKDNLSAEWVQQLNSMPNKKRVSFIKKMHEQEPSQWQKELEKHLR